MLLGGYYDLATPVLAQRYALTHSGVPLERAKIRVFAAGHTPFEANDGRKQVSAELHDFVTKGSPGATGLR
ncbi:MAG: hypothetical protein ACREAB_10220 [Blastocatellia bacterium]